MEILNLDISFLKRCICSLQNCVMDYNNTSNLTLKRYIEDACEKRFEYSVEASWKIMKKFLKLKYGKNDQELTISNIFSFMEKYGYITSSKNWRSYYDILKEKNYEYDQKLPKEIMKNLNILKNDLEFLYKNLELTLVE